MGLRGTISLFQEEKGMFTERGRIFERQRLTQCQTPKSGFFALKEHARSGLGVHRSLPAFPIHAQFSHLQHSFQAIPSTCSHYKTENPGGAKLLVEGESSSGKERIKHLSSSS